MTSAPDFETWVAARAPALSRFAYVLTGDPAEADEVVVDALAAVHARWRRRSAAETLEEEAQVLATRAHVRRGFRRAARGHTGVRGSRSGNEDTAKPEHSADTGHIRTPARTQATDDTESSRLWRRCAELSVRQRAALVLHCYAGFGPATIAEATGTRRASARAALREALAHTASSGGGDAGTQAAAVRRVLVDRAEHAVLPTALAERARDRSRRSRRRRAVAGGTAAVALLAPVAWAVTGSEVRAPTPPEPPPQASTMDTSGWRWESWGGISVQVPPGWGHGDLTQWCTAGGPDGPAVDRPEIDSTDALCSLRDDGRATYTGGLVLRRAQDGLRLSRADVAPYATARIHTVGDVTLTVVDVDPAVGNAILASALVVGSRDHHGCGPRWPRGPGALRPPPQRVPIELVGTVAAVSVCRYGLEGWSRPTLVSSRRLTGGRARDVLAALEAAPVRPRRAETACRAVEEEFAVLELWPGRGQDGHYARGGSLDVPSSVVVRYDGCRHHGVYDDGKRRVLTAAVLDPVLVPPWTGEAPTGLARPVR